MSDTHSFLFEKLPEAIGNRTMRENVSVRPQLFDCNREDAYLAAERDVQELLLDPEIQSRTDAIEFISDPLRRVILEMEAMMQREVIEHHADRTFKTGIALIGLIIAVAVSLFLWLRH